jgi:O-antigen ligase
MRFAELKLNSTTMLVICTVMFGAVLALGAALTMDDPIVVEGIVYMTTFIALAWKYPFIALGITFASGPFQQDLSSGFGPFRFSIAELNLLLAMGVFLFRIITQRRRLALGPTMFPFAVYFTICIASSLADWRDDTVLPSLLQMVLYFVIAILVFSQFSDRLEQLVLGLYAFVAVCAFLSVMGMITPGFQPFGLHKNGLGGSLACGVIVCAELFLAATSTRRKVILFIALSVITAGLIFSLSRGAWLGCIAGVLTLIIFRGKFKFALQAMMVLGPLVAIFWTLLPQEQREYAFDFNPNRQNIAARYESIDFAKKQFYSNPIYGVGVGLRKEYDATNVVWVTLAETGAPGLIAFLVVHIVFLLMVYKTHQRLPRNDKLYTLLAVGGSLVVHKLLHGIVDHYWSRGELMIAWSAAGMATGVYFVVRRRLEAQRREAVRVESLRPQPARVST